MSHVQRGPGWWIASDGKWYPPEQHPDYRPPPPPPPPTPDASRTERRGTVPAGRPGRRERKGLGVGKVALGVCLGLFLFVGVCVALIGGAANEVTSDANRPGTVRVVAAEGVCWGLTLTGGADGNLGQSQREGCGPAEFELPKGLGANVVAHKRSGDGTLTLVATVEGEEVARETTDAEFGFVTVSR